MWLYMVWRRIFFLLLLFFVIVVPVHAQTIAPMRLTVSPVFINLATDPGGSASAQIRISNDGVIKEQLSVGVKKFAAGRDGERPIIVEPGKDDDFLKWITFSKNDFSIEPGETKTISLTVNTPKNAALGYYYLVTFERSGSGGRGGNAISLNGITAVPVLLEVNSPNAERALSITRFYTDHFINEYLPVGFNVQIKNEGNVHVVPVGDIFIDQGTEKNIAVLPMNPGRSNVLPQTKRTFYSVWDDGFIVRKQKQDGDRLTWKTEWDFSKADKFRIGRYTAHVIVIYDNGQRDVPIEAMLSFWIIPWKIILIAVVILILIVYGLFSIIRGFYKTIRRPRKK